MNSKEFEILNSKLDYIFDEVERLREDLDHHKQEMREKSLECKFEDAQQELTWARENRDHIINYYKDIKNNYYSIKKNVEDRYEDRMRDAIERGIGMHAPEERKEI